MLAALDRINADTAALANLSALLASNANILRDAIRRAEAAIESVRAPAGAGPASSQPQQAVVRGGTPAASKAQVAPAARGAIRPPHVDELLVAPTVVANQLYDLVAEERALGDAIFMLGRAVERGRISPHVFAKMTRSLGREWYLKKALVRKIAHGMGLLVD